jgi:putative endonuclease
MKSTPRPMTQVAPPAWQRVHRPRELGWRLRLERRVIFTLQELAPRLHPGRRRLPHHLWTGERGELEAFYLLRRQGFHIVARRWRTPELKGDLDLVSWDGDTLVMIEVKTRNARDMTPAGSAVDDAKKHMLRRMAQAFRRRLPRAQRADLRLRFDLLSVYLLPQGVECEHLQAAFPAEEERRDARG